MKTIPLSKGYVSIIDDEDYERVSAFKWSAAVQAGKYSKRVYAFRFVYGRILYLHHFILGITTRIDHRDGDGTNNQRLNLRSATRSQNGANRPKSLSRSSSKFKGVSWDARRSTWRASIKVNRRAKHLGAFKEETDAATAYNLAAVMAFGDFAHLNVPLIPAMAADMDRR